MSGRRWPWASFLAVAAVLGFVASVGPGLDGIEAAFGWLSDHPVVLLAVGFAAVATASFLLGASLSRFGINPRHRDADKRTFENLVDVLPRAMIEVLRVHDFGDSWSERLSYPLYQYVEGHNNVEDRFHDRSLEKKRGRLHAAAAAFTERLGGFSIPCESGHGFFELNEKQWVRNHPPGDEPYRRFEAHRRELNQLADEIVAAYDDLVEGARRRVP